MEVYVRVGKGIGVWDRGADRNERMLPWPRQQVAFVIRQRGDRHVRLAEQHKPPTPSAPRPGPEREQTRTRQVWLPDDAEHPLLLVMPWRRPTSETFMLLVRPQTRRSGRRANGFLKAYRRRWGVEKEVISLFSWIATQTQQLLHPRPTGAFRISS